MSVAFYISGHGFGHAIRQIEIINTLLRLDRSRPVIVRTSAPHWLFERMVQGPFTLIEGEVDTGLVQRDSLTIDEEQSMRRASAFYADLASRAREEAALLRRHDVDFVVADAPPLACESAALAGLPSAVCSNFTWDWIYAEYADRLTLAPHVLPAVRDAYGRATAGWRMPMHGGFETVPSILDLPFVARQPSPDRTRDDVRLTLGLPRNVPLALVSFGGYGLEGLSLDRLDCMPAWGVVVVKEGNRDATHLAESALVNRGPIVLDESSIYSSGLRYQDLVRAVDVVITKPGYGIISDCVANGTAILYTSRGRFAEYDVMVAEMPRYLRCRFIDGDALREGRWRTALDGLMAMPAPPETPRLDGARVVAELVISRSSRETRSWER